MQSDNVYELRVSKITMQLMYYLDLPATAEYSLALRTCGKSVPGPQWLLNQWILRSMVAH